MFQTTNQICEWPVYFILFTQKMECWKIALPVDHDLDPPTVGIRRSPHSWTMLNPTPSMYMMIHDGLSFSYHETVLFTVFYTEKIHLQIQTILLMYSRYSKFILISSQIKSYYDSTWFNSWNIYMIYGYHPLAALCQKHWWFCVMIMIVAPVISDIRLWYFAPQCWWHMMTQSKLFMQVVRFLEEF